jgi:hypothetical protein
MSIRTVAAPALLSLIMSTTIGCSNPGTSPSGLAPTQSIGSPSVAPSGGSTAVSASRFGGRTPGVVYVTSQGLYYDTFVVTDPLPVEGRFQRLTDGQTEFGPGQPGYLGGRWWVDENSNGVQDSGDHYFLCPLLPPGRTTP